MTAADVVPPGPPPRAIAAQTVAAIRRKVSPPAGPHLFAFVSAAVLTAAIHLSYEYLIAPSYGYMLLTYTPPVFGVYATMIAVILGISLIMPVRMRRASDFMLWGLYVLVVIPSLTISHLARTLTSAQQLTLGLTVAACFSGVILVARLPTETILPRLRPVGPRLFWTLIAVISAATYLTLAASGNLRLALPGFGEIYALRSSFSASNANALLPYLMSNQGGVINPLLMAVGISARRPVIFAAGVVGELLLYATAGHKSVLFAIPAVLLVAWIFRGERRPAGVVIAWGFSAVIIASAVIDEVLNIPWLSSLFTRRFIDLPGLLTGAWINVFSSRPKAGFAYSFLAPFLPYHYPANPPFVVATAYFNEPLMNANANLIADGYANFGWFGIAFEMLILAVVLVCLNVATRRVRLMPAAMIVVMPIVALSNASMVTSLLTHGIVLMIVIFAIAPAGLWFPAQHAGRRTLYRRTGLRRGRGPYTARAVTTTDTR